LRSKSSSGRNAALDTLFEFLILPETKIAGGTRNTAMNFLSQILTPQRTLCRAPAMSKEHLFETIAKIVCDDQQSLPYDTVLNHLTAREKLGSTGMGQGIAIPHCRISQCTRPMGALLTLDEPLAFDAPDDLPVDLLFVLLVPAQARQEHLDILANIAQLISQTDICSRLRAARDNRALYDIACGTTV
jgi:nitrogen PTS system EIIA component